jgi:uncharacterized protein (TIGR02231 family)
MSLLRVTLGIFLLPLISISADLETKGKVTAVTVFSDRADVNREAPVRFSKGGGRIVFRGVPQGIEPGSVKVSGLGDGVAVSSVEVRQNYASGLSDPQTEALKAQLEVAQQKLESLRRKSERLVRLQALLVDMSSKSDVEGKARSAADTRELLNLIVSYGDNFSAAFDENSKAIGLAEKQVKVLSEQLSTVNQERSGETVVVVDYESAEDRDGLLKLSYQVYGASWSPEYGVKIGSSADKFEFNIYGLVSQRSGEDWLGAKLVLSTALPQVGLSRPELPDWFIDVERPVAAFGKRALQAAAALEMDKAAGGAEQENFLAADASAPISERTANISRHGAVTFDVPALATVKSDGAVHKMKLATWTMSGTSRLIAVPSQSQRAFREVKLVNNLDLPLLPGNVNVFAGEQYLGTQGIPYTTTGKELVLPAGVFEGISVERVQKRRYEDDSGLIRSMRRIRSEYEIKVKNGSSVGQQVVVLESAPVSRNEKIKAVIVEAQPPALAVDDPSRISKGEGTLEWRLDLAAGAEAKLSLAHEVEFESSTRVTGLEEWR